MNFEESLIAKYYSIRPTDFNVVVKFELQQAPLEVDDTPSMCLTIELRPFDINDNRRLLLTFSDVTELELRQLPLSLFQIPHLEINSIKERQWEGRFFAVNSDGDMLSFLCKSFNFIIQEVKSGVNA